ncbi:MAG: formylglycine-generating enzyme family protein, partial [Thermodesulfobacteriota bacterium]
MGKSRYLLFYVLFLLLLTPAMVFSADLNGLYPPMEIEAELLEPPKVKGMVFVKGGCFDMGDTFGDGDSDERPVHEVCVDDFYLGKYEVTVGEFREFVHDTDYRTAAEKKGGCYYWTGETWEKGTDRYWLDP